MEKLLVYENGLRAVVEYIPYVRSASVGFWAGVGSAYETADINGLSHFTEHMMFKGTPGKTPQDIASAFEDYGANVNAFTGKECTCYYYRCVDEYNERCFSLLSEIFFKSTFPAEELDKERKVIAEEINMVEDSPEDVCYDVIASACYGDDGLGRTILGPKSNVKRFSGDDIRNFMGKFYSPSNVVIAIAGDINLKEADRLIRKYVLPLCGQKQPLPLEYGHTLSARSYKTRFKTFEQSNIALSFPSVKFNDGMMTAQAILNLITGGGMSSRLFQAVREKKGLAYSVYTAPSGYRNVGTFNVFLNINGENAQKAVKAVKDELDILIKDGISQTELERAKTQLKSALVFSQENVQTLMSSMGKMLVLSDEIYDAERKIKEIDVVNKAEIDELIKNIFVYSKLNAAYVGKQNDIDILGIFA